MFVIVFLNKVDDTLEYIAIYINDALNNTFDFFMFLVFYAFYLALFCYIYPPSLVSTGCVYCSYSF